MHDSIDEDVHKPAAPARELALLFLLALIWSASFMFIKIAVDTVPPITLSFGRVGLGALVIGGYVVSRGGGLPRDAGTWSAACVVGFLGNALPFSLIHWGEQSVDSGLAAILMGVMPVAVALMAHFAVASDPLTRGRALGIAMGFAGLVVLVGWDALAGIGAATAAQIAIICAALCYATTTILVRRMGPLPGGPMAAATLLCGAAMLLPLALIFERPLASTPDAPALFSLAMLGVFSTGIATLMYFRLIASLGATTFAQINYLIPMMGVGWGIIVLGEKPGLKQAVALVLILVGVALVSRSGAQLRRP